MSDLDIDGTDDTRQRWAGSEPSGPAVAASSISKMYGQTVALEDVDLTVYSGEVVGVIGHNGAGKSTLMRLLAGLEQPDAGTVVLGGDASGGSSSFARVRMAYQETSLCPDLTVAENIVLSAGGQGGPLRRRRTARRPIADLLDAVFPDHGISPDSRVESLTMAQRQIVEICRAMIPADLRVLILDEPTESLGPEAAASLYRHVASLADSGVAVILISHRIHEILAATDRVVVLRDGACVAARPTPQVQREDLLAAMGAAELTTSGTQDQPTHLSSTTEIESRVLGQLHGCDAARLKNVDIVVRAGEIVGLAGLDGQGQEDVLDELWRPGRTGSVIRTRSRAYITGDRQRAGIFPRWSVAENTAISALPRLGRFGIRDTTSENEVVARWIERLNIRGRAGQNVTALSGGNQQKVLVARAMAADADLILLDDPFRGVDVNTKAELYALLQREAAHGRGILWYSTENSEMTHCDRVYVLRAGRIVAELAGEEVTEDRIVALSFEHDHAERHDGDE